MTRVLVSGATGKLGAPICAALSAADDFVLAGRVARSLSGDAGFASLGEAIAATAAELVIDVTAPEAGVPHTLTAIAAGLPMVLGTTGMTSEDAASIDGAASAAGVPVLFVPNFSITAVLMMRFAAEAARFLPDCTIVEEHHVAKVDSPSGTALRTADLVEEACGRRPEIASVRLEGLVANQSVLFGSTAQTLEIRTVTTSREAFVPGALLAIRGIRTLAPGLHVGLELLLD
ncbi:MAG: 4-hydroxy-tetrahydrodipicolinate reductase [Thermoleophilia bacterium]|nr:4-hydroxy-tetrahydrodipicolinate reductase [Thermoleophilia bacterium]